MTRATFDRLEPADRHRHRRSWLRRLRRRGGTIGDTASGSVLDLDDDSFFAATAQRATIVDFWAPWCGPSAMLHPIFDEAAGRWSGRALLFARVDVDENPGVASTFEVMSIPTIIVFDADGREVEREIGVPSRRRLDQLVRRSDALTRRVGRRADAGRAG